MVDMMTGSREEREERSYRLDPKVRGCAQSNAAALAVGARRVSRSAPAIDARSRIDA